MNPVFFLSLVLFVTSGLMAQPDRNQKFAAAAYLGVNLSQVHGDTYFGYNRPGVRFGAEIQYLLHPKYFLSLGVGYAQEGARPSRKEVNGRGGNAAMLRLNVVELPVLFHYRLGDQRAVRKKNKYGLFRNNTLHGGVKLTRLVSYGTENRGYLGQILVDPDFTETPLDYRDLDLAVVGGITFRPGLNFAIFIQHGLSVRGLYDPEAVTLANRGGAEVYQLRPYSLTVGGKAVLY